MIDTDEIRKHAEQTIINLDLIGGLNKGGTERACGQIIKLCDEIDRLRKRLSEFAPAGDENK